MEFTEEEHKKFNQIYTWSKADESGERLSKSLDRLIDFLESLDKSNGNHYQEAGLIIHPDSKENIILTI